MRHVSFLRRAPAAFLLLALLLLLPGCGKAQSQAPEGKIMLCRRAEGGRYLLLFHSAGREASTDTICLYDPGSDRYETVFSREDLWTDDCQLFQRQGVLYYCGNGRIQSFTAAGEGWQISDLLTQWDEWAWHRLSPEGDRYLHVEEGEAAVYSLSTAQELAMLDRNIRVNDACWSGDGSTLGLVTGDASGAAIWKPDTREYIPCDLPQPEGWVSLYRPMMSEDGRFFFLHMLMEDGCVLLVWDVEAGALLDSYSSAGELTALDVSGGSILLEESGSGPLSRLVACRYPSGEKIVLDQTSGRWLAGCFTGEGDQALAYCFDPAQQTGQLSIRP